MARLLNESPSTVSTWKRVGRIPAEKQPHVLAVAENLDLPVTATNIIFPLGIADGFSPSAAHAATGNGAAHTAAQERLS